jgi:hypothetical protein
MSVASVSYPVKAIYAPASNISVEEFADLTNIRHNLRLDSMANIAIRSREVSDLLTEGEYVQARDVAENTLMLASSDHERSQAMGLVLFAWLFPYLGSNHVDSNNVDATHALALARNALDGLVLIVERSPEEATMKELGEAAEQFAAMCISINADLDAAFSCVRLFETAMRKAEATGTPLERAWLGNIYYEIARSVTSYPNVQALHAKHYSIQKMRSYVESIPDGSVLPKLAGTNMRFGDDYKTTLVRALKLLEQMSDHN